MTLSRRWVIKGTFGFCAVAALPAKTLVCSPEADRIWYLGTARASDGSFIAALLDPHSQLISTINLPGRGHGIAIHPKRPEYVVFARRPGTFAMVLDGPRLNRIHKITSKPGRHFYGHGCFSRDGTHLFASENDFNRGVGVIGVYNVTDSYRRVGEFSSGGIGPHELRLMPGGEHLVVANGGIRTHPDQGRAKLNLADMRANVCLLDVFTGTVAEILHLDHRYQRLSIRHVDVNSQKVVGLAMQFEGNPAADVPLAALWRCGREIIYLKTPASIEPTLRHYTGSIRFDQKGEFVAVTFPRGYFTGLWETATAAFRGGFVTPDSSGISSTSEPGEFLIAGSDGRFRKIAPHQSSSEIDLFIDAQYAWDNHVSEFEEKLTADYMASDVF